MNCQVAGIKSPVQIDINNPKIWFGRNSSIRLHGIIVIVFGYSGVRKDKVQALIAIKYLVKYGGQLLIVAHVGLVECGIGKRSRCLVASFLVTTKDVDLPGAGFA